MVFDLQAALGEKAKYITSEEIKPICDTSSLVVMDGIAVVDEEKAKKLRLFLLKRIVPFGSVVKNDIFIPINPETGKSYGAALFEMGSPEEAKKVISGLHNTPMDKLHTFHVYSYADIVESLQDPTTMELPNKESFAPLKKLASTPSGMHSWLQDPFQRDQFLIRYKDQVEVYWCDSPSPQLVHDGKSDLSCSQPPIEWSPLGTYVVTYHGQGIMLHSGSSFTECGRFPHKDVQRVLFSRHERYALTWNGATGASVKDAVAVWDVASNHLLRRFPCTDPHWPSFAFSADEQFLAVKGSNGIGLFSLPDFRLLRQACFGVPSIADFAWAPTGAVLSYVIPETESKPATVVLLDVQQGRMLQSVSLNNVQQLRLVWAPRGSALALVAARKANRRAKTLFYQITLVRMALRNLPVETLPIEEAVEALEWEKDDQRFALLTTDAKGQHNVSFYAVTAGMEPGKPKKHELTKLYTIANRACNRLYWSPAGNYILLAGLGTSLKGKLEFWDVSARMSLKEQEHFSCTDVAWSPNGHFCVTSSCYTKETKQDYENGFNVWDVAGESVAQKRLPQFLTLQFRPWPMECVDEAMEAKAKSELAAKEKEYKKQMVQREAMKHIDEIRKKLGWIDAFRERRRRILETMEAMGGEKKAMEDKEEDMVEIEVEEEVELLELKIEAC